MKYDLEDVIPFGKHKGKTLQQIIDEDAQWVSWLIKNTEHDISRTADLYYQDVASSNEYEIDWRDSQE